MACYWIAIKGNKMQMCKKRTRNIISGSYFGLFPPVAERSCQHDCFLSDLLSLCLKRKFCDTCKKMCLIRKMYSIPAAKSLDGKLKLSTLAEDAHPPHSWREASQPLPPARDIHSLSGWWRLYSLWGGELFLWVTGGWISSLSPLPCGSVAAAPNVHRLSQPACSSTN